VSDILFVLPGPEERRSGGTLYDLRLVRELEARGLRVRIAWLAERFPFPTAEDLAAAERLFAAIPEGTRVVVDCLALGAMPEVAARHGRRLALIALLHHPLSFEPGLPPETARRLLASERVALAHVRHVIVPSRTIRDLLMREFGVAYSRITVAPPGTDPAQPAPGSRWDPPQLLSVAALTPRKDHLNLIRALAHLAHRPWRLDIAGATTVDPATTQAVRAAITAFGFEGRIRLLGELSGAALEAAWQRADLFVSASRFEGFGMAIAEALARGLPIVAVRAGAVAELVPESAGILVEPGHPAALAAAIRCLLDDPALQVRLRAGALAARARLPSWEDTVRAVLRLLAVEPVT
jgi:glycosyltransferase involved in cell wall biosynthesis